MMRGDMNKELYNVREELKEASRIRQKVRRGRAARCTGLRCHRYADAGRARRAAQQETLADLMKTYKLPLLAAAFDLQSRLTQILGRQRWAKPPAPRGAGASAADAAWEPLSPPEDEAPEVNCFLSKFTQGREAAYGGDARDPRVAWDGAYAIDSTLFCIAELLGWQEVIRREVTFIQGSDAAVNLLLDALRYQFSGEDGVQGKDAQGEDFRRMQLYNAEMRAIGEVMIVSTEAQQEHSHHRIMGYSQFLQMLHADAAGASAAAADGATAANGGGESLAALRALQRFQDAFKKLRADLEAVARSPATRPKRRMAMLRVLLCKLVDELDPSGLQTALQQRANAAEEGRWRKAQEERARKEHPPQPATGAPAAKMSSKLFGRSASAVGKANSLRMSNAGADEKAPMQQPADELASGLSEEELTVLLTPMSDLWQHPESLGARAADLASGGGAADASAALGRPLAGRLLTEDDTRVPLVPRTPPRWQAQYDHNLPEECRAFLINLYGEMHALKLHALMEHQRRLQWMEERETIARYRDAVRAAPPAAAGVHAALRKVLPPALQDSENAAREALRRVSRLEHTDRLAQAEQSRVQLDNMRVVMQIERTRLGDTPLPPRLAALQRDPSGAAPANAAPTPRGSAVTLAAADVSRA